MVQDGKLILDKAKSSFYRDFDKLPFAKTKILDEARRQLAAADAVGMAVEWRLSDAAVANKLDALFTAEGLKISVTHFPE